MAKTKYAVLMYADPAHTRAMSQSAVDVVLRKDDALREDSPCARTHQVRRMHTTTDP